MFDTDTKAMGYLPNYTRLFAHNPAVYLAWQQLNGAVKDGMELRRYSRRPSPQPGRSSPPTVGWHMERFYATGSSTRRPSPPSRQTTARRSLPQEVAVVNFAGKVAADATSVTEADVADLRGHGLDDTDIFRVILAVGQMLLQHRPQRGRG